MSKLSDDFKMAGEPARSVHMDIDPYDHSVALAALERIASGDGKSDDCGCSARTTARLALGRIEPGGRWGVRYLGGAKAARPEIGESPDRVLTSET